MLSELDPHKKKQCIAYFIRRDVTVCISALKRYRK